MARAWMTRRLIALLVLYTVGGPLVRADARGCGRLPVEVRGKALTLALYLPPPDLTPKGTLIVSGGDVGWVGLGARVAETFSAQGYVVAGVNSRQYITAFTARDDHLTLDQIPGDYRTIADALEAHHALPRPVILAGVSEGAALTIAAAANRAAHQWIAGVLVMGLPPSGELAWRWKDMVTWVTKTNAREPSFRPVDILANVSPLPLWMIQSTHDEYVAEADYRQYERAAREPRRLVLIDASNHRFTDRIPQLTAQVAAGLDWIRAHASHG